MIKSALGRRHSRIGRRPEDLSSVRVCVLTCLLENTMITPVKFKSRVWVVWVEAADTGSAQTERELVNKDRQRPHLDRMLNSGDRLICISTQESRKVKLGLGICHSV